jgi:hypothetical protein
MNFETLLDEALASARIGTIIEAACARGLILEDGIPILTRAAQTIEQLFAGREVTIADLNHIFGKLGIKPTQRNVWVLLTALAGGRTRLAPAQRWYEARYGSLSLEPAA